MPFWYWLLLAALFGVIEVAVPAMVCIWLAAAALGVALAAWVLPGLAWEYQALIFAGLVVASVSLGRIFFARARSPRTRPLRTGSPQGERHLNRRAESHIGRSFTLDKAIVDGRGRIRVDDTVWLIAGPDLPAGTRVHVTGVENALLRVEPI